MSVPELTVVAHPKLWSGDWSGEVTGANAATLTSPRDEAAGIQLVREFRLTADEVARLTGVSRRTLVRRLSEAGAGYRELVDAELRDRAVRLLHEYTGRGPTETRTTINHDSVMILFGHTLTKGEKKLADNGDGADVLQMRHRFQLAMREDLVTMVETEMERKVVAFMSTNHIDPDMAAELFVLEPLADAQETPDLHASA